MAPWRPHSDPQMRWQLAGAGGSKARGGTCEGDPDFEGGHAAS